MATRLLLIMPRNVAKNQLDGRWVLKHTRNFTGNTMPPSALATLAALTPTEVDVTILDENIEEIDYDRDVDIVGISAYTSAAPRAYQIAARFREKGVTVVLGGIHASMMPHEAIQHADSVVIGEAESVWSELLGDYEGRKLKQIYEGGYPDISDSPIQRRELLNRSHYLMDTVQTSRGCPFSCKFCTVHKFNGRKMRHRNINRVVEEIKTIYEYIVKDGQGRFILFLDDNFYGDPQYAKSLCRELIALRKTIDFPAWTTQISFNATQDDEMLELLFESGCRMIYIGFETVDEKNISLYGKKQNKITEYAGRIQKARSFGIDVMASFIVGNEYDDRDAVIKIKEFADANRLIFPDLSILTPYPGSEIYDEFRREGRILHKEWDKYDNQNVAFAPRNMSARELQDDYAWLIKELYSASSTVRKFNYLNKAIARKDRTHGLEVLLPSYGFDRPRKTGKVTRKLKRKRGAFGTSDRLLLVATIISLLPHVDASARKAAFCLALTVLLSRTMTGFDALYILLIFDFNNSAEEMGCSAENQRRLSAERDAVAV